VIGNSRIEQCFTNTEDVNALNRRFSEIEMTRENTMMINAMKLKFPKLARVGTVGRRTDKPTNKRNRNTQETILVHQDEPERVQMDEGYGKEPNMEAED
jgi:hypothetical protein